MPEFVRETLSGCGLQQLADSPDSIGLFTIGQGRLIATVTPNLLDELLRPTEPLTPIEQEIFVRASFGDTIGMATESTRHSREAVESARDGIVAKYGVRRKKLAPAISKGILAGDLPIDVPSGPKLTRIGRNTLVLIADILDGNNDRRTGKHLGIPPRYVADRKNGLFSKLRVSGENALPRAVYEELGLVAIVRAGSDS